MGVFENFDLLSVGITVAATLLLGVSVYFSDRMSLTNRMFFGFSLFTACWGVVNYFSYQFSDPGLTLLLLRGILFFAVLQAFFLYEFFSVFPNKKRTFSIAHNYVLVPIVSTTAILTLTPYVFSGIVGSVVAGQVAIVQKGIALPIFGAVATGLVLRALYVLFKKLKHSEGETRRATYTVLIGTAITFALIIFFNLVMATVFTNPRYIPFSALFVFPFVAFAAYAIMRQHLFNVKVIATSALVFLLSITSFGEIVTSHTGALILFKTGIFVLVLVFGINLIRSVIQEVEQREKIQKLAKELEETNKRQETLIHFIGHEVKGFLTKAEGAFASLTDGDFGQLPEELKPFVERSFAETRQGVGSVEDILKASNIKKGTVAYAKEPFDLKALVTEAVEKAKIAAAQKGLALTLVADDASYQMTGDRAQINDHVLRNLIDNAINYTPSGSIVVSLAHENGKVVFAVKDSGIGITDEDKQRLFTEGGHGKDSQTINVHSTGYGLYIAKQITEAMGGTIRAESEGAGRGSTFIAEFPAG